MENKMQIAVKTMESAHLPVVPLPEDEQASARSSVQAQTTGRIPLPFLRKLP